MINRPLDKKQADVVAGLAFGMERRANHTDKQQDVHEDEHDRARDDRARYEWIHVGQQEQRRRQYDD